MGHDSCAANPAAQVLDVPTDPTVRPEWNPDNSLPVRVIDSLPPYGVGGARGVEPSDLTPSGAPPRDPESGGRRLLRDATLRRRLLRKASATPVPGVRLHPRELEQAVKPPGHEREFFKPASPLLTNAVFERPEAPRKAAEPTWEDLPPPRVAAPPSPAELDESLLDDLDGTLEPAEERVIAPSQAVAGWIFAGAVVAAAIVLSVAMLRGPSVLASDVSEPPRGAETGR